jgi:CRISPR system Cascade subunit CasA
MNQFNLVDDPWIKVLMDRKGNTKLVSLKNLFDNANEYIGLAGDTKAQEFAMMRIIISIIQTVYSRYDSNGNAYDYLELDEMSRVIKTEEDDEQEQDIYMSDLMDTWKMLWEEKKFTSKLCDYLNQWRDSFNLFDKETPFMQVSKEDINQFKLSKKNPSTISGKSINRLISESENKIALFSPRSKDKNILDAPEIARWLITYHGYTSLSDKVIFGTDKYKSSKGWLFDIGGLYLSTDNLFETLMLNLVLCHPDEAFSAKIQRPAWEYKGTELINRYLSGFQPDNLAELYTNWSRAIYIDPEIDLDSPFSFKIVKLPEINHVEQFLEPMTMWRFNKQGNAKDKFTPRKHQENEFIWQSFNLIAMPSKEGETYRPGIIKWLQEITPIIDTLKIQVNGISMKDDGNATSWLPVDDINDHLNIYDDILIETQTDGWVENIKASVELTKEVVEKTYGTLLNDILEIRNSDNNEFVSNKKKQLYYMIDGSFKNWISSINAQSEKNEKSLEWKSILREIVLNEVQTIVEDAGPRDYIGIRRKNSETNVHEIKNIATSISRFNYFLSQKLPKE